MTHPKAAKGASPEFHQKKKKKKTYLKASKKLQINKPQIHLHPSLCQLPIIPPRKIYIMEKKFDERAIRN
jgi:hypothetical protein